MTETCRIQWIDESGNPTPDSNTAIGWARTYEHDLAWGNGRTYHHDASEWFPICAEHALRLSRPGMWMWEFKAMPAAPTIQEEE
jgi:hypothetical protein